MTREQVPPGTRNARTGEYIRKPVRVTGGAKPPKSGCPLVLLAWAGAATAVVARMKGWT